MWRIYILKHLKRTLTLLLERWVLPKVMSPVSPPLKLWPGSLKRQLISWQALLVSHIVAYPPSNTAKTFTFPSIVVLYLIIFSVQAKLIIQTSYLLFLVIDLYSCFMTEKQKPVLVTSYSYILGAVKAMTTNTNLFKENLLMWIG